MFAKTIVLSDAFLDMPMSARCLYFTLGMLADDDGFVNAPRSIMRQCGSSEDDMRILISKKFVLEFESGVIVIKHWRINNYLRNDRYVETKYIKEKSMLTVDEKGGYKQSEIVGIPGGIPGGIPNSGIPRLGKDSIVSNDGEENNKSINLPNTRDGMDRLTEKLNKPSNAYEYLESIGIDMSDPFIIEEYKDTLDMGVTDELLMYAASRAKAANKATWNYIRSIVFRWHESGITTIDQAKADLENYRKGRNGLGTNVRNIQTASADDEPRTEYHLTERFAGDGVELRPEYRRTKV